MNLNYLDSSIDFNEERVVEFYDELPLWSAFFGMMMLDRVPMRPEMQVLDVGCGTGFPLLELAGRLGPSSRLYGIDPWHFGVERARKKAQSYDLRNVEIIEGDAAQMKFKDESFDLITSNCGINNFTDPDAVLRECFRVLRRGGTIAITSNYTGHMRELYEQFAKVLPKESLPKLEKHILHRSNPNAIVTRMEGAGFRVTDVETDSFRMRYASGRALFNNYFIRLGFLPDWLELVPEDQRAQVFAALEAAIPGEVALTVPVVYVEATR